MANLFDYLTWRGDLSFRQAPFNPVDALILSALSYIHYGPQVEQAAVPVALEEAAEEFFTLEDPESRIRVKNDLAFLQAAAQTRRFGKSRLGRYRSQFVPEEETQFAAMTFLLDDGTGFLAFRGTDGTLVGWKEDFNMTFQPTIPAQRLAAAYAQETARELPVALRLGGHSKGGNLAVFAAAKAPPALQERILEVYNNDGPGFTDYLMGDPGYLAMVPKIRTYVPESSVIGMLLEHEETYTVVKSTTVGLLQHDLYSWVVEGPDFVTTQQITGPSRFLDATIKAWLAQMTNQERNQLVDGMFHLLSTGGVSHAPDIFQPRNIRAYIKALSGDETMRRLLSTEFRNLLYAARMGPGRPGVEPPAKSPPSLTGAQEESAADRSLSQAGK